MTLRTQTLESLSGNEMFETLSSVEPPALAPEALANEGVSNETDKESPAGQVQSQTEGQEKGLLAQEGESEEPKTEESEVAPVPSFKFSHGGKEFELPEDAELTVRIDGQDHKVTAKDLRRNYQGKVPWEKHYGELKRDRERFDSEVKAIDARFRRIIESASADPETALMDLIEMAGKDPTEYLKEYEAKAAKVTEELAKLSEEERRLRHEQKKVSFGRMKLDRDAAAAKAQKEREEDAKYLSSKQAEHQISDEEINAVWQRVKESGQDLTKFTNKEVADLMVTHVTTVTRPFNRISEAIDRVDPNINTPQLIQEVKRICDASDEAGDRTLKGLKDDDILWVVRQLTQKEETVATEPQAKPAKVSTKEAPPKATSPKTPPKKAKPMDEGDDDLGPVHFRDLFKPYSYR